MLSPKSFLSQTTYSKIRHRPSSRPAREVYMEKCKDAATGRTLMLSSSSPDSFRTPIIVSKSQSDPCSFVLVRALTISSRNSKGCLHCLRRRVVDGVVFMRVLGLEVSWIYFTNVWRVHWGTSIEWRSERRHVSLISCTSSYNLLLPLSSMD